MVTLSWYSHSCFSRQIVSINTDTKSVEIVFLTDSICRKIKILKIIPALMGVFMDYKIFGDWEKKHSKSVRK